MSREFMNDENLDCMKSESDSKQQNLNVIASPITDESEWSLHISSTSEEPSKISNDLENHDSCTINEIAGTPQSVLENELPLHHIGIESNIQKDNLTFNATEAPKSIVSPNSKGAKSDVDEQTLNVTMTSQITEESDWSLHISTTSEEQPSQYNDKIMNYLKNNPDNCHMMNENTSGSSPTKSDTSKFLSHFKSLESTVHSSTIKIAKVVLHRIDFVEHKLGPSKQDSKDVIGMNTPGRAKRCRPIPNYVEPKCNTKLRRN